MKLIKLFFIFLIFVNLVYVWMGARKFGAQSIDVYANWLLKAKILYKNNGYIPRSYMENPDFAPAHWQYPIGWPAMVYLVYKVWGINEQNIFNLFPVFYTIILGLCYINLRKSKAGKFNSLIFTYFYSMTGPLIAQGGRMHPGNADILICLLGWLIVSFRNNKWLVTLLVMAAAMIKTEGIFWAVFLGNSGWLFLAILPSLIWQIIIRIYNIPSDFGLIWQTTNIFSQIWGLILGIIKMFLNINNWYIIWPIFFLSIKRHELWTPLLIMSAGFGFVYLFTNLDSFAYVTSSFDRVLLQLSPFWILIWSESTKNIYGKSRIVEIISLNKRTF